MLEGESSPVSSAVVQAWLDLVYSRVDGTRQQPQFASLSEAARALLLFADAAGTCSPVLQALGEGLSSQPGLTLPVEVLALDRGDGGSGGGAVAGPTHLELALSGCIYYLDTEKSLLGAIRIPSGKRILTLAEAEPAGGRLGSVCSALAAALERWLYLAGRLGLVPLARLLLQFYKTQLVARLLSLFATSSAAVFSRRVLECMPRELLVEGFLLGCMNDPRVGRVDILKDTALRVCTASPEAAAWFEATPDTHATTTPSPYKNTLRIGSLSGTMGMRIEGMAVEEQRWVVQEVLRQLDKDEQR
ncbi:hypothetical protein HYH02_009651 [Chlamydomonas schloesseri]|uniref:Uncharacterized protein n=1 Tax=Chlamydomonas schloesseri TaxID=2026947 RepID=A0A835TBL8_9CHLO|nr:hypothetical protein HYH02_009651 [Chlamydomonas schloesseri]|eukprot:KAG2442163.1 hypothetical protein HYH02_009651 [Chlamydomonas schloesseri]